MGVVRLWIRGFIPPDSGVLKDRSGFRRVRADPRIFGSSELESGASNIGFRRKRMRSLAREEMRTRQSGFWISAQLRIPMRPILDSGALSLDFAQLPSQHDRLRIPNSGFWISGALRIFAGLALDFGERMPSNLCDALRWERVFYT